MRHPHNLMQGFREAVDDSGLRDLGMIGYRFTWERSRGSPQWVEERLDRALASQSWLSLFDNVVVENLEEAPSSDHSALLLDFMGSKSISRRVFKFEHCWLREAECRDTVRGSWAASAGCSILDRLSLCGGKSPSMGKLLQDEI